MCCERCHACRAGMRHGGEMMGIALAQESLFGKRQRRKGTLSPNYAQSYTHRVDNYGDYPPKHACDVDNLFFHPHKHTAISVPN